MAKFKVFKTQINGKEVRLYSEDEVLRFLSEIMDEVQYYGCSELIQKMDKLYVEKDLDTSNT